MSFRLRKKPVAPVNDIIDQKIEIDGWSIELILLYLKEHDITECEYSKVFVLYDSYDMPYPIMNIKCKKYTDDEFKKLMEKYQEDLNRYHQWEKENKELIELTKKNKASKKKEAEAKRLLKEEKRLLKEEIRIRKELDKVLNKRKEL